MFVQFFRQGQTQNSLQAGNVSQIVVGLGQSLNSFQVGNVFEFFCRHGINDDAAEIGVNL